MENKLNRKHVEKVGARGVTSHLGKNHPVVQARKRWLTAPPTAENRKPEAGERQVEEAGHAS